MIPSFLLIDRVFVFPRVKLNGGFMVVSVTLRWRFAPYFSCVAHIDVAVYAKTRYVW